MCSSDKFICPNAVPMHLLKEGTFAPFAKSNFMGHVVYGDDKQITIITLIALHITGIASKQVTMPHP